MTARLIIAFLLTSGLISGLGLCQAMASTVPETPPSSWNKGSFGLQTQSEYFFSHANYSEARGGYDTLVNGNKWASFENRGKLRYGFTNWVSLFGGVGGSATNATSLGVTKTNSSLSEVFIGADFLLVRRWWLVVPEVEASYPTDTATRLQTAPLTSDNAPYANLGVFLFKPYRYLRFESYLGFHLPGNNLASLFRYSFGTEIAMFGAFTLGGAIQGYESVLSDSTSNADRQLTQATADATSERFWAYNPALLEAKGWLGLRFDRAFGMRLGYAKTLNGVRNAEGQSVLLSLYYNTPGTGTSSNEMGVRRTVSPGAPQVNVGPTRIAPRSKTNGGEFKTEPEPNDPELFDQQQNGNGDDPSLDNTERLFDHK